MEYGRHAVLRCRRCWAHAPVIHAVGHVDHEKELHGNLSISMHACDSVSIVMVLRLAALWAAVAPLKTDFTINRNQKQFFLTLILLLKSCIPAKPTREKSLQLGNIYMFISQF